MLLSKQGFFWKASRWEKLWQSTHRHQQVCFWPDVSTFILRSSSKDMRGDLRSDSYVLLASCSEFLHECVNRSGVDVNAKMRPEDEVTSGWRSKRRRQAKNKLAGVCECFVKVFFLFCLCWVLLSVIFFTSLLLAKSGRNFIFILSSSNFNVILFWGLESTKISSYEPVSSQKYENRYGTKICNFTVWCRVQSDDIATFDTKAWLIWLQ